MGIDDALVNKIYEKNSGGQSLGAVLIIVSVIMYAAVPIIRIASKQEYSFLYIIATILLIIGIVSYALNIGNDEPEFQCTMPKIRKMRNCGPYFQQIPDKIVEEKSRKGEKRKVNRRTKKTK